MSKFTDELNEIQRASKEVAEKAVDAMFENVKPHIITVIKAEAFSGKNFVRPATVVAVHCTYYDTMSAALKDKAREYLKELGLTEMKDEKGRGLDQWTWL